METEVFVYVDIAGAPHLAGRLWARTRKARESATFECDPDWLQSADRFSLEPALMFGPGPFHTPSDKPLFGAIGDSAPDRWGRVLMRRADERHRFGCQANTPCDVPAPAWSTEKATACPAISVPKFGPEGVLVMKRMSFMIVFPEWCGLSKNGIQTSVPGSVVNLIECFRLLPWLVGWLATKLTICAFDIEVDAFRTDPVCVGPKVNLA